VGARGCAEADGVAGRGGGLSAPLAGAPGLMSVRGWPLAGIQGPDHRRARDCGYPAGGARASGIQPKQEVLGPPPSPRMLPPERPRSHALTGQATRRKSGWGTGTTAGAEQAARAGAIVDAAQ
jgi:hypothetical protein